MSIHVGNVKGQSTALQLCILVEMHELPYVNVHVHVHVVACCMNNYMITIDAKMSVISSLI